MLRKKGGIGGPHGWVRRSGLRRLLPTLLTLILLIPLQSVAAAVQATSGTTSLANTLQYGNTAYSVDYRYPSQVEVGSSLNVEVTVHVNALTGLVEYVTAYRVIVNVFIGTQHFLNGDLISEVKAPYLYPGGHWGPVNVSIPITEENTGVAKGQSTNASVSVTLQDSVWYGTPRLVYETEPAMQGGAGTLVIQNSVPSNNSSAGQTFLPYAFMASGVVLLLLAVFLPRGPRMSESK
jgi:hypothetical protein